ncbi:MAG: hypothetical protein AAGI01_17595, partial [Myxococcota bacterium]
MTTLKPPWLFLEDERHADDVAAAPTAHGVWLAWSRAVLARESVHLTHVAKGPAGVAELGPRTEPFAPRQAFRPVLSASSATDVHALGAIVEDAGRLAPALCTREGFDTRFGEPLVFALDGEADATSLALSVAPDGGAVWVAYERVDARGSWVELASMMLGGPLVPIALPPAPAGVWRRAPAIASDPDGAWLTWVEGDGPFGGVHACRISPDGPQTIFPVSASPSHQEAPTVAVFDDRHTALIAWHETLESGRRWLRCARMAPSGEVASVVLPEPPEIERAGAPTDQSWEFPRLLLLPGGAEDPAVLLAGRSAHNVHVAIGSARSGLELRTPQCPMGWGGIGRISAL